MHKLIEQSASVKVRRSSSLQQIARQEGCARTGVGRDRAGEVVRLGGQQQVPVAALRGHRARRAAALRQQRLYCSAPDVCRAGFFLGFRVSALSSAPLACSLFGFDVNQLAGAPENATNNQLPR